MTPTTRLDRPPVVDLAVAAGITCLLLIISPRIPDDDPGQRAMDAGAYGLIVIAAGSLAFRRVFPRATLAVSTAAVTLYAVADYIGGPVYLAPLVALATMANLYGPPRAVVPAVVVSGVLLAAGLVNDRSYPAVLVHLLFISWAVAAVLIGDAIKTRAQQLQQTLEEEAGRRVAEERVRIARDLHDVVAHSLASISIQAAMGAHVIDRQPEEARAALVAIKAASREALDELRATLDVLREGPGSAPTAPTAGLADLATLTAGPEQAGLTVTVERRGLDGRRLPTALDVTAYRIVQESLTNVMRHARARRVTIRLTGGDTTLEIEVLDDGAGGEAPAGGGHGLVGMRERAALVGGEVTAGPRADGPGFRVRAVLPLPRPTGSDPAQVSALHDATDDGPVTDVGTVVP